MDTTTCFRLGRRLAFALTAVGAIGGCVDVEGFHLKEAQESSSGGTPANGGSSSVTGSNHSGGTAASTASDPETGGSGSQSASGGDSSFGGTASLGSTFSSGGTVHVNSSAALGTGGATSAGTYVAKGGATGLGGTSAKTATSGVGGIAAIGGAVSSSSRAIGGTSASGGSSTTVTSGIAARAGSTSMGTGGIAGCNENILMHATGTVNPTIDQVCGITGSLFSYGDGVSCTNKTSAPTCTVLTTGGIQCCMSGTTVVDNTYSNFGCGLGLNLNFPADVALPYAGPASGLRITLTGSTAGQEVRISYSQTSTASGVGTIMPYWGGSSGTSNVTTIPGTYTVPFKGVTCPSFAPTGTCIDGGPSPFTLSIDVAGYAVKGSFNVCVSNITPIAP